MCLTLKTDVGRLFPQRKSAGIQKELDKLFP